MASGSKKPKGDIKKYCVKEEELWARFNHVFSKACSKQSTYKFGLIKAILDNLLSATKTARGMELSYRDIFSKFSENYWNLITKYHLKQLRKNSRYQYTEIEKIFHKAMQQSQAVGKVEFSKLPEIERDKMIAAVTRMCKVCVVGALYEDFDGYLYGFTLNGEGIWINLAAYEFMLKHRPEIERLNYFAWAQFMENVNSDDVLVGVLGKLEKASPERANLSVYRKILQKEFDSSNCFYCGCRLEKAHVDHVIPWSFVKEDHLWNFVLACPACNTKKKDKLPTRAVLSRVIDRNKQLAKINSPQIELAFKGYDPDLLWLIWEFANSSGIKEISTKE